MSEVETRAYSTTSVTVRAAELRVTAGPSKGVVARIDRPFFTVGKGDHVDLRLDDDTVSREHLRLRLEVKGLLIEDAESRNGTWLGGMRIDRALVTSDVVLTLGASTIELVLDRAGSELLVASESSFEGVIGTSVAMRHVFATLAKAADTEISLLLEGESGVGKEVLAHAIHHRSSRKDRPFVIVDCSAIPANLIESELFGHEKGAFTGATQRHVGLFEQADGGTVFLDEIGELPIPLQPKLLRVLEQREVRTVGGTQVRPIDVRVIAATNRNLAAEVKAKTFREDLFYRLSPLRLRIPSLRERPEDIVPIANAFLRETRGDDSAELPPDLVAILRSYSFPGNVRELRNVVSRYAALGFRDRAQLLGGGPTKLRRSAAPSEEDLDLTTLTFHEARRIVLERFERTYLPAILAKAGGVVTKASELAGVARPSFHRMLGRLDLTSTHDHE